MSGDMTYVFGDLKSGAIIEEMPLFGVSITKKLSDDGELRAAFHLDMTGKNNSDLVSATIPGERYIIAERDSVPVWGGMVWSRTYQSQAKSMELYCRSFEAYPLRRKIAYSLSFAATDKRNIFLQLWRNMQASSSIGVTVPSDAIPLSQLLVDLNITASEKKFYRTVMDSLANADPSFGFDWTIDVTRSGVLYAKNLRLGFPTLGSVANSTSLVFEYPGSILNYWQTDSMSETGTHIETVGAGEGDSMLTYEVVHQDLINAGWVRWDQVISKKDVSDSNILKGLGLQFGAQRRPTNLIITAIVKGNLDPIFGSFGIGDACNLVIKDPMHTNAVVEPTRMIGWTYTPKSSSSTEEANIDFEVIQV